MHSRCLLSMRGMFSVWKPRGITSSQAISQLKSVILTHLKLQGASRQLKLGHGGTLDKDAEGVLVIGVGKDCKQLSSYLTKGVKEYTTTGKLGEETDTYDSTGSIVQTSSYEHINEDLLLQHLKKFTGHFCQSPPVYSAIKQNGERLSDRARKGQEVPRPPARPVVVETIDLLHFNPPLFSLTLVCHSGFYVRSLIHDLGISMGTSANMAHLQRTADGPFTSSHALTESQWSGDILLQHIKFDQ